MEDKLIDSQAMTRDEAVALLGGTVTAAAREIGITQAAVSMWPKVLTPVLRDRVQAALYRRLMRHAVQARAVGAVNEQQLSDEGR